MSTLPSIPGSYRPTLHRVPESYRPKPYTFPEGYRPSINKASEDYRATLCKVPEAYRPTLHRVWESYRPASDRVPKSWKPTAYIVSEDKQRIKTDDMTGWRWRGPGHWPVVFLCRWLMVQSAGLSVTLCVCGGSACVPAAMALSAPSCTSTSVASAAGTVQAASRSWATSPRRGELHAQADHQQIAHTLRHEGCVELTKVVWWSFSDDAGHLLGPCSWRTLVCWSIFIAGLQLFALKYLLPSSFCWDNGISPW